MSASEPVTGHGTTGVDPPGVDHPSPAHPGPARPAPAPPGPARRGPARAGGPDPGPGGRAGAGVPADRAGRDADDLVLVSAFLRRLDRALSGPARARADLLAEARDSLSDAVEAYRGDGLDATAAQRLAVAEFGSVAELAPAYQAELAAGASRTLALHTTLAFAVVAGCSVLMWWGAPGTDVPPPAGYRLLAGWLDRLNYVLVTLGLLTYGWLFRTARRGRTPGPGAARVVGIGAIVLLAATAAAAAMVYCWSVRLTAAMASWPPTVVGIALIGLGYAWLGRAAWHCLLTARRRPTDGPTRLRPRYRAVRYRGTGRPSS